MALGGPPIYPSIPAFPIPVISAHTQKIVHSYVMHFPAHPPREKDPHYRDFEAYRKRTVKTAKCAVGLSRDDFSECRGQLELHHSHIEFSLQNGVDLKWLESSYPGVSDATEIGAWIESADNLEWLCEFHHRGAGGIHTAAAADFEAEKFVRGLMSEQETEEARPGDPAAHPGADSQ